MNTVDDILLQVRPSGDCCLKFTMRLSFQRPRWIPLFVLLTPVVIAQVQLLNITSALYPELSATCIAVLNQAVACDSSITWAGQGRFESDDTLSLLCTTACATALSTWQRRVIGACTTRFNNGAGSLVLPQLWPQVAIDQHNLLCLQQK